MYQAADDQDLQERWFAGVHSDVGGGYPEEDGGIWRAPFAWVCDEARRAGLSIDEYRLYDVDHKCPPSKRPWDDRQHESLTSLWWPAEFFPKFQRISGAKAAWPRIGLGRRRYIPIGAAIDKSALNRIRDLPDYRPANFSPQFLQYICSLPDVPETLAYARSIGAESTPNQGGKQLHT
jgi:hypothetical protein